MSKNFEIDEYSLLLRLRDGEPIAFELLYNKYKGRLAKNLYKLLKSWEEVEEVLQELFVRVWDNRRKIDPQKSFQAYLYRIANNLVYDYYRKIAKDKVLMEKLWDQLNVIDLSEIVKDQIITDKELMRTIDQLPAQRKLVFKLCKLEGKSYAEVSQMLNISHAAINDHITKANRFIQQHYNRSILLITFFLCSPLAEGSFQL